MTWMTPLLAAMSVFTTFALPALFIAGRELSCLTSTADESFLDRLRLARGLAKNGVLRESS